MKYPIKHIFLFAIFLLLTNSNHLFAQVKRKAAGISPANALKILPLDPAVRFGKLRNGFTYYIRRNEEPKTRVELYLVNKVGSILESEDQRGLAHFMEHMNFNGTSHFPKNELVNYLQKAGVRFGADINAYTSFDETVYQLPLPTDDTSILNNGIKIMRDWAQNATLDPEELDKERGVVLEEKRLGKGALQRMEQKYFPVVLNGSLYADRLPIGLDTVLNNFKQDRIKRFYIDWYRPDLQALIIVGDINVDQMEQTIRNKFSDLKNPVNERARISYSIPLTGKDQFVIATDKEMTNTELQVLIKHKAPLLKNEADYHTSLLQVLYNNMLSDRYAELLQKADVPYLDGSAGISSFMGDLNAYTATMVAKPGHLKDGFKLLWRTTEQVKRFGFTASELERAKKSFLSSYEAAYMEKNKTRSKSYVKEYQENFLHGTASPGIETEHRIVIKNINTISLAEINLISTEYIRNTNRDILLLAPDKEKANLPDEAAVLNWMREAEQEKIYPYVDKTSDLPFLVKQPAGGKIISEQKDTALNITTLFLSNGLKVVLKPTTFRNNEVSFNLFGYGGSSLYADSDYQSASYATSIVASSGMGNYNPEQLNKYLEDKQVSMGPFITEREQGISGGSTTKDLETAMQAIYCYFTAPRKDEEIYKGLISRLKGSLINRLDDPNSVFSDTVRSVLSNNNFRRTGPSLEKIEKIDLNRSYEIFKDRFSDASNFTISFVGSFDEKTIRPLLEKYLASLPSSYKHEQAKDLGINIPMGKITKNVYKGIENKASVKLIFSGVFDYSMAEKVKLDALKEVLEIRLLERLREDESGVYSPGVSIGYEKYPHPNFNLMVSFGCAAENTDKLVASTLDEINKLKANGPLQINLDKYKAESRRSFELGVKTNSYWADYLNNQLQDQNDLHDTDKYLNILDSISVNDIKSIAQKYLSGDNYIKLELLPKTSNP